MDNEQCRGQLVNPELQRCLSPGRHHQRVEVVRGNSQHPRRLGGRYTPKERWTLQETTEKYRGAVTLYRTGPSFGSITLASTVLGGRPSRHAKAVRKVIQSEEHRSFVLANTPEHLMFLEYAGNWKKSIREADPSPEFTSWRDIHPGIVFEQ